MAGGAWISQGEAAFILQCGSGITERQARRVLAAGLAGEPKRLPGVHLYGADSVHELTARAELSETELDAACSPWTCVWITSRIERHGCLPMAVALGGFVVGGADIVGASTRGTLTLAEPGQWIASITHRRLSTGPGRDWWIRGLDRDRPVIRAECEPRDRRSPVRTPRQ